MSDVILSTTSNNSLYHSYFYIRRLSEALQKRLVGARLLSCFSQEKDELVFHFYSEENHSFFIRADVSQGVGIVSFPESFVRTRSNSADLFPGVTGEVVKAITQTLNDRSFHFHFHNGLSICFKMYGNRSNILLHNGLETLQVFNRHLKKDIESPPPADVVLDQSREAFLSSFPDLKRLYPTFDRWMHSHWEKISAALSPPEQWDALQAMVLKMDSGPFLFCHQEKEVILSFFPMGEVVAETQDPIEAGNLFYQYLWQVNRFLKEKDRLILSVRQQLFDAQNQLKASERQWVESQTATGYRRQADLLMAYGFDVENGALVATFPDFETSEPVAIKLKKELSVAENAERLYKKAKGQEADLRRLENRIDLWKSTISDIKTNLARIEATSHWAALKPLIYKAESPKIAHESLPFHTLTLMGFEIRVGKNARGNDEILRMARKDDLWFHARDVAGSHALVCQKKGSKTPQPVIERAAQLAAYFSKAKTESLVPVMVAERKYVRKNKTMAAGEVRVEKEKTILVPPVGL